MNKWKRIVLQMVLAGLLTPLVWTAESPAGAGLGPGGAGNLGVGLMLGSRLVSP